MWEISEGTPVVGGFVDTSAAVLQTPMKPGQLTHNAGSTDVLAMCVTKPKQMEGILTRPVGIRGQKGEATWLSVLTIAAAGSALAWARRELFDNVSDITWNKLMLKACATATPEILDNPHLPACLPDFSGKRAAIDQGNGASFLGLHLATTKQDLLAALVRGLVRNSADHYRILSTIHRPAREVFSMGSVTDVALRMHDAWKGKHVFKRLEGDSMTGLVELARRAMTR
jgi:sugar (pentulose or hexulose) kinase